MYMKFNEQHDSPGASASYIETEPERRDQVLDDVAWIDECINETEVEVDLKVMLTEAGQDGDQNVLRVSGETVVRSSVCQGSLKK